VPEAPADNPDPIRRDKHQGFEPGHHGILPRRTSFVMTQFPIVPQTG
jgi:hypothetical protein